MRRLIPHFLAVLPLLAAAVISDPAVPDISGERCPPPDINVNISEWETSNDINQVAEIRFVGTLGPFQEKRRCKIKCLSGHWVGPLCTDGEEDGRYHPLLRSCMVHLNPNQLIISYRNVSLKTLSGLEFLHGSSIEARCRDMGLYKLLGNSVLQCRNGVWSSRIPTCVPTTQLTNFSGDSPPTIMFHIPTGSAAVGAAGQLVVYPGSILHFDCLFLRTIGNPTWTWTPNYREYPTGWAISPDERNWRYRLSLYYAKSPDSGVFTCSTPRGLTNSITIVTASVECPPLSSNDTLMTMSSTGTVHLGHTVVFNCPIGYRLNGTSNSTCQATGKWSDDVPSCVRVRCPSMDPAPNTPLAVVEHNNSVGGRAVFACPRGHRLEGHPGMECGPDGKWSGVLPTCTAIECHAPLPPHHGRLLDVKDSFLVGESAHYTCDDGYVLVGEPTTICNDNGIWSGPTPFCKIACPSPGNMAGARFEPSKSLYVPGDHLIVSCPSGMELLGPSRLLCMANGAWSDTMPECRSLHHRAKNIGKGAISRPNKPMAPVTSQPPPESSETDHPTLGVAQGNNDTTSEPSLV